MRRLLREQFEDLFVGHPPLVPRKPYFMRVMEERDGGRAPDVELYRGFMAYGVEGLIRKARWEEIVLSLGAGELEGEEPTALERGVAEALLYQLDVLEREEREETG